MIEPDPLWYKDAIIYELHVRAFHDTVGDGVGDFRGLTRKLDYLEDLGVTAIWLLPFYPSPLKDDGYDIAEYTKVNPQYGRLDDFREFLDAAHRRGIRVITELVLNHTSDRHPWFQRARLAPPGSPERDFYVWSDTPDKYRDVRIIFKDFETSNWSWDPVARAYYWHRFYSHQPDLNFDNPAVWQAIVPVVDFWLGMGVDGVRLDAVPYLFEREGTSCENLPETHKFLKALRAHVDRNHPNRMILAEANQWPEDAIAYFGDDDECHMAFHFPLMPRLFMALHQEDRFPILDIFAQTPALPERSQWCLFLRNHDELTLEMVTDEERDYMYRAYARDPQARINLGIRHRLAPLLSNDRRRIELMNALLFSLPGTPVIYYGDEIGMGDNIYLGDRNGVRTPMQWSSDRNAGFSRANSQQLYFPVVIDPEYHFEAVNVEAQQNNPSSLLWWMKRLIALRKQFKAFGRGTIEFLRGENPKVFAFVRRYEDERILVVANLSRFVQFTELDLSEFSGLVPEELYGGSLFPPIGEMPYLLTLGPYGFYWFSLDPAQRGRRGHLASPDAAEPPTIRVPEGWEEFLFVDEPERLEVLLPEYLRQQQPAGQAEISAVRIRRVVPHQFDGADVHWLVVVVDLESGLNETVLVPLTLIPDDEVATLLEPVAKVGLARLTGGREGLLCDAMAVPACGASFVAAMRSNLTRLVGDGELAAVAIDGPVDAPSFDGSESPTALIRSVHFNASLIFGDRMILKAFRHIDSGVHPDLEICTHLARRDDVRIVAPLLGYIEYRRRSGPPITLAVLHEFIPNQGTAWQATLDHLSLFFERVAAASMPRPATEGPQSNETTLAIDDMIGGYIEIAHRLGLRTAEMHRAIAADAAGSAFAPEPFTRHYQRSIYQSMRNLTHQVCRLLAVERPKLPEASRVWVEPILERQPDMLARFHSVIDQPLSGRRIRCHGDYHLGQLLSTGADFVLTDFEGDPALTLGERQFKRSPLRDVACMLHSFHHAAYSVLLGVANSRGRAPGLIRVEDQYALEPWAQRWSERVAREFLDAYFSAMDGADLLPATPAERMILLDAFLLEEALEEVARDLRAQSDRIVVPLRALSRLLGQDASAASSQL